MNSEDYNYQALVENGELQTEAAFISRWNLESLHGAPAMVYLFLTGLGIFSSFTLVFAPELFLPFLLIISSPYFIISLLRRQQMIQKIKAPLIIEQFLLGSVISIILALFLEGTLMSDFVNIRSPFFIAKPTYYSDFLLLIATIIIVGSTEEFSKIATMYRVITPKQLVNQTEYIKNRYWYRYINTPSEYVLASCSSAAGFAVLETVKYVYLLPGVDPLKPELVFSMRIHIAFLRAAMAIPFHIILTGIYSVYLTRNIWTINQSGRLNCNPLTYYHIILAILPSAILHGLYDASLFCANLYPNADASVTYNTMIQGVLSWVYVEDANPSERGNQWAVGCIVISFIVLIVSMIHFSKLWRSVLRDENDLCNDLNRYIDQSNKKGPGYPVQNIEDTFIK